MDPSFKYADVTITHEETSETGNEWTIGGKGCLAVEFQDTANTKREIKKKKTRVLKLRKMEGVQYRTTSLLFGKA